MGFRDGSPERGRGERKWWRLACCCMFWCLDLAIERTWVLVGKMRAAVWRCLDGGSGRNNGVLVVVLFIVLLVVSH